MSCFRKKRKPEEAEFERPHTKPITGEALSRIADEVGLTDAMSMDKEREDTLKTTQRNEVKK